MNNHEIARKETEPLVYPVQYAQSPKANLGRFLRIMTHLNQLYGETRSNQSLDFDYLLGNINGVMKGHIRRKGMAKGLVPIHFDLTVIYRHGQPNLFMLLDDCIKTGYVKNKPGRFMPDIDSTRVQQGMTVEEKAEELINQYSGENIDKLMGGIHENKFGLVSCLKKDYGLHQETLMGFFLKNLYLLKKPKPSKFYPKI